MSPRASADGGRPTMPRWCAVVLGSLGLLGLVAAAVMWPVTDRLPPQVASHWGTDGVDNVQSLTGYLSSAALVLLGTSTLLAILAWRAPMAVRRVLGAVQSGMAWLIGTMMIGGLLGQLDLTDPYRAPDPGVWIAIGLLPAAVVAAVAWRLLPAHEPSAQAPPAVPTQAARVAQRPNEQLTWLGHTPLSAGLMVAVGAVMVLAVALGWRASPWAALLPAAIGMGVLWMCRATVVVDRQGLRVRSGGWVTWLCIPLDRVRVAEVDQVRPLAQFGGYGLRWGRRGRGFVTRGGAAVRVDTADGDSTWVSVDDAAQAAATLNTLAASQRIR